MRLELWLIVSLSLGVPAASAEGNPRVVASSPKSGARQVDPALREIAVTFSEPMMDRSWSWVVEDKTKFPEMTGQPSYREDGRTCVLPVKLAPGREYVLLVNSASHKNFKSKDGKPAIPYRLVFSTRKP